MTDELKPSESESIGEIAVAEYIVFLLSLDTYTRYVYEHLGDNASDDLIHKGVLLAKLADSGIGDAVQKHLLDNLDNDVQKRAIHVAFQYAQNSASNVAQRTLRIRRILKRGGPATLKSLFKGQKALAEIRTAMTASTMDDADKALDKLGNIPMNNARLRKWVDDAADKAGSKQFQNPVETVAAAAVAAVPEILKSKVTQSARPGTEDAKEATATQNQIVAQVQVQATQASQRALAAAGKEDATPTISEVHGMIAATVAAALSEPEVPANLPAAFINKGRPLDTEQVQAALTDGRVLVAAGAGAGKSTTLVSRIAYLINNKGANAGRIVACSFNKKAADQLADKIKDKIGANAVTCRTMDSLFRSFVVGNKASPGLGSTEEKAMFSYPRFISDESGSDSPTPAVLTRTIMSMWEHCDKDKLQERYGYPDEWLKDGPPPAKKANQQLTNWRGNDISLAQAKELVTSKAEAQAYIWYEMYLGLKGDIPGWKPPCQSDSYDRFMDKYRPGKEKLGDFGDIQTALVNILRTQPAAKERLQNRFDHILVDEAQDLNTVQHNIFDVMSEKVTPTNGKSIWMIGDDKQCPASDTMIATPDGLVRADQLKTGDKVLAWRNGQIKSQTAIVSESDWTWGYKIVTESGKTLTMSPNHKLWAGPPVLEDHQTAVYLMFRSDMGFRVGITGKGKRGSGYLDSFAGRAFQESAEKMWILSIHNDVESAKLEETSVSLRYGIPTLVFNGLHRKLNQDRINQTFKAFGRNGMRCLEQQHLSLDYPHWISGSYGKYDRNRQVVQLLAHGNRTSMVRLEWSPDPDGTNRLEQCLAGTPYEVTGRNRFRLRRSFGNYREARDFAVELARKTDSLLNHTLWTPEGALQKITAAGMFPGMKVPVRDGDSISLEEVVSVERCDTTFVNLEVDDASNFFGGDILSSNCIYQFRGSRPELFTAFAEKDGWQPRLIRTNYRCAPEIVEAANKLSAHNKNNLKMECRAAPDKNTGVASITVDTPEDTIEASISSLDAIVKEHQHGVPLKNFAILARTNNELNDFETACIINETPYIRKGGVGFMHAAESRCLLGFIDLANGTSYKTMAKSMAAALMMPHRGTFSSEAGILKAIEDAMTDVARKLRVNKDTLDPRSLLEGSNLRVLADAIKRPGKAKAVAKYGQRFYDKTVMELATALEGFASDVRYIKGSIEDNPTQTTEQLLNLILDGVSGTAKEDGKLVTRTLRESITTRNKLWSGDAEDDSDDDDEDDRIDEEKAQGKELEVDADGNVVNTEEAPVTVKQPNPNAGLGAVQYLFKLAAPNAKDIERGTDPSTAAGFLTKMEHFQEISEKLRIDPIKWEKEHGEEPPPAVTLSTIHKVKGAEWENVTVLMPKGKFPMPFRLEEGDPEPTLEQIVAQKEAERNLGYVALTRAQHTLKIVCPKTIPGSNAGGISEFVSEAGLKPGENVSNPNAVVVDATPEGSPETKTASEFYGEETFDLPETSNDRWKL